MSRLRSLLVLAGILLAVAWLAGFQVPDPATGVRVNTPAIIVTLTNLNPASGSAGATVILTGTGFGSVKGTSSVAFNGTIATTTAWATTSITATVPIGATTGSVIVQVAGISSNTQTFTVTASSGLDCGMQPTTNSGVLCGPTNTGLAGVGLTTANLTTSSIRTTTSNGQVLTRLLINGDLCIVHSNVTLKESKINGGIYIGRNQCGTGSGDTNPTGTIIQDNDVDSGGSVEGIDDINGSGTIIRRNNICCAQNYGSVYSGNNITIRSNYGHDESSSDAGPHFDGWEVYSWSTGGVFFNNNTILQKNSSGATSPLNITEVFGGSTGTITAEYNLLQSQNSAYVIITADQGGPIVAVFNGNRLWQAAGGSGYWYSPNNSSGNSHYNGSGNCAVTSLTGTCGAAVAVPTPH